MDRTAVKGTGTLLVAALLLFAAGSAATYVIPLNDAALFEYFGKRMLDGQQLYRDLIDNKLPSIYLVNAAFQYLFGANYLLHRAAETVLALGSIVLFYRIATADGLKRPGAASLVFAAGLLLYTGLERGALDMTEVYAVFLMLLALRFCQTARFMISGAALIVAATFWVPSLFFAVPLLYRARDRGSRLRFTAGCIAGAAGAAIVFALTVDVQALSGIFLSWLTYERYSGGLLLRSFHDAAWQFFHIDVLSPAGILAIAALGWIAKPVSREQRFSCLWVIAAIAGALVNERALFIYHYLLPAVPALTYLIFTFMNRPVGRRQVVFAMLALCAAAATIYNFVQYSTLVHANLNRLYVSAAILRTSLPPDAAVGDYSFEPTIYLLTDLRAATPLEYPLLVPTGSLPRALQPSSAILHEKYDRGLSGAAAILVDSRQINDPVAQRIINAQFREVCVGRIRPWRIYFSKALSPPLSCEPASKP